MQIFGRFMWRLYKVLLSGVCGAMYAKFRSTSFIGSEIEAIEQTNAYAQTQLHHNAPYKATFWKRATIANNMQT